MNIEYLAGFFDGEGYIGLAKYKARSNENSTYGFYLVPNIVIVQKHKKILEEIRDFLNKNDIGCFIKERDDACYQLIIGGMKRAIKFCNLMENHIICKKPQLLLLKSYIEKRLSLPQKTHYDSSDLQLYLDLKSLKKIDYNQISMEREEIPSPNLSQERNSINGTSSNN